MPGNKKQIGVVVPIPECPVCVRNMTIPIYQCKSGHSVCNNCTKSLQPPICPMCREDMLQTRNWQLEALITQAKVPCVNKALGCIFTMPTAQVNEHMKECIFRRMACPMGEVFGKCSWNGTIKEMMDHFKERHPNNCNLHPDVDVEFHKVNLNEDECNMYLILQQNKFLFILTFKIDTLAKMAYWTVQHIGSKNAAQQYIYEIHVTSKQNNKRKFVYIENCFNDALKAADVFRLGKCAMIPLNVLVHFIKDQKLAFRFFIKRIPPAPPKNANAGNNGDDKSPFKELKIPGPKGPGPKGPGPSKKQPKSGA